MFIKQFKDYKYFIEVINHIMEYPFTVQISDTLISNHINDMMHRKESIFTLINNITYGENSYPAMIVEKFEEIIINYYDPEISQDDDGFYTIDPPWIPECHKQVWIKVLCDIIEKIFTVNYFIINNSLLPGFMEMITCLIKRNRVLYYNVHRLLIGRILLNIVLINNEQEIVTKCIFLDTLENNVEDRYDELYRYLFVNNGIENYDLDGRLLKILLQRALDAYVIFLKKSQSGPGTPDPGLGPGPGISGALNPLHGQPQIMLMHDAGNTGIDAAIIIFLDNLSHIKINIDSIFEHDLPFNRSILRDQTGSIFDALEPLIKAITIGSVEATKELITTRNTNININQLIDVATRYNNINCSTYLRKILQTENDNNTFTCYDQDTGLLERQGQDTGLLERQGQDTGLLERQGQDTGLLERQGQDTGLLERQGQDTGLLESGCQDPGCQDPGPDDPTIKFNIFCLSFKIRNNNLHTRSSSTCIIV
jgi:hypothetical protein